MAVGRKDRAEGRMEDSVTSLSDRPRWEENLSG